MIIIAVINAGDTIDCSIEKDDMQEPIGRLRVPNNVQGYTLLLSRIQAVNRDDQKVFMGFVSHTPCEDFHRFFSKQGFEIMQIEPDNTRERPGIYHINGPRFSLDIYETQSSLPDMSTKKVLLDYRGPVAKEKPSLKP